MKNLNDITIIVPLAPGSDITDIEEIKRQKIKCIPIVGTNPSANRNLGIKAADTEYIAFINGHTNITSNWVEEVHSFFKNHPEIDIVGGPQLTSQDEDSFGRASGIALSSAFGAANANTRYTQGSLNLNANETMLTSANLICRKRVFQKVKFDETLYPGEDPKFISDAIKERFKVAYSPDIIVYNKRRNNILSFIKQIFSYGIARPKKETLIDTLKSSPLFLVPPSFVIYLLFFPLLFWITSLSIWPIYLYLALNISFSYYEAMHNRNLFLFLHLPILFLIIHLGYGFGFIIGTIKRWLNK